MFGRRWSLFWGVFCILAACSGERSPGTKVPGTAPEASGGSGGAIPTALTYIDQGWNTEQRDDFYYTSQGSNVMPYTWFLALEQATVPQLFSERSHLERFGWIYGDEARTKNPDRLPIGFTQTPAPTPGGQKLLGLSCAGCHTSDVLVGGRRVRIDGAPSLADFGGFVHALRDAINANAAPDKWQRFALRVAGPGAAEPELQALRKEYSEFAATFSGVATMFVAQEQAGPGRFDALSEILNALSVSHLGVPENLRPLEAPVSYPQLWLVTELDWVQWNPLASNPLVRNVGEALSVFGWASFSDRTNPFQSTVQFDNLYMMEEWLATLKPPRWDEALMGAIDPALAQRGAALFRADCRSCHNMPPYDKTDKAANVAGLEFIRIKGVPTAQLGTDPVYSKTLLERTVKTGALADVLFGGRTLVSAPEFLVRSVGAVTRVGLAHLSPEEQLRYNGYRYFPGVNGAAPTPYTPRDPSEPKAERDALKAGPLLGMWATGPFLHNGSVPTLSELLSPASERRRVFWVGGRELDTEKLGFESGEAPGRFRFDTALRGNDNQGHAYPPRGYSVEERRAVLEFLKEPLRFLPAAVAPN